MSNANQNRLSIVGMVFGFLLLGVDVFYPMEKVTVDGNKECIVTGKGVCLVDGNGSAPQVWGLEDDEWVIQK